LNVFAGSALTLNAQRSRADALSDQALAQIMNSKFPTPDPEGNPNPEARASDLPGKPAPDFRVYLFTWGILGAVILGVIGAFIWSQAREKPLPVYGAVPDFTFTNQFGAVVSSAALRGQVWIGDIIFTRCPLQCIKLTRNLAALQSELSPDLPVRLITLTADPEYDTPPVLLRYAQNNGAEPGRWHFLTGPKSEINRLAVEGLKFVVLEKSLETRESPNDLFIHSGKFVLVDKSGRVRGWFDGDEAETRPQLVAAVKSLLRERTANGR
jgi:protein SCO1